MSVRIHNCKEHFGEEVTVGPYTVWAGGIKLNSECLGNVDVLVTLTNRQPFTYSSDDFPDLRPHSLELLDYGGVPEDWADQVQEIVRMLEEGTRIAMHCQGGFGRTGTLLASLVAVLESSEETPDPIMAIRERYCFGAVETVSQAEACFALRGQQLPQNYPGLRPARG